MPDEFSSVVSPALKAVRRSSRARPVRYAYSRDNLVGTDCVRRVGIHLVGRVIPARRAMVGAPESSPVIPIGGQAGLVRRISTKREDNSRRLAVRPARRDVLLRPIVFSQAVNFTPRDSLGDASWRKPAG